MNFIKNKVKIFIRNIKYLIKLIKEKEIPKQSIYNTNLKIKNLSDLKKPRSEDKPILLLSSYYFKVTTTRINEFNQMFTFLNNFDIFFFNHQDRDSYMRKHWVDNPIYELYKRSKFHQMKSDIFRYCFIFENGGYWLDFKSSVFFNIDELMDSQNETLLILSSQKIEKNFEFLKDQSLLNITEGNIINNWVFGGKKNSNFLKYVIDNISEDYFQYLDKKFTYPKQAILELTGPYKITELFYRYINVDNNKLKEFYIVNESEYEFKYISDHGRDFKLIDNVFTKHYSNIKNKKIIK